MSVWFKFSKFWKFQQAMSRPNYAQSMIGFEQFDRVYYAPLLVRDPQQ